MNNLIKKLEDHSAIIGIVGLGYVGLPLMLRYAEVGFKVVGFDVDDCQRCRFAFIPGEFPPIDPCRIMAASVFCIVAAEV